MLFLFSNKQTRTCRTRVYNTEGLSCIAPGCPDMSPRFNNAQITLQKCLNARQFMDFLGLSIFRTDAHFWAPLEVIYVNCVEYTVFAGCYLIKRNRLQTFYRSRVWRGNSNSIIIITNRRCQYCQQYWPCSSELAAAYDTAFMIYNCLHCNV